MSTNGTASQGSGTGSNAVSQISSSISSSMSPPSALAPAPVATQVSSSRLVAPSGFVGSIGGTVTILLSTGQQDITIIDRPGAIALSGASGGNDIVRFAGAAASYTVTRSGSRVIISDGDTSVAIAVSGSPVNLVFADGTRSLRANDNTVLIGDQVAGATPAAISAVPDVAGVPAAGTPAVRGQLILAEGGPVVVAGELFACEHRFGACTQRWRGGLCTSRRRYGAHVTADPCPRWRRSAPQQHDALSDDVFRHRASGYFPSADVRVIDALRHS